MNKTLFLLLFPFLVFAQGQDGSKFQDEYQIHTSRIKDEIKIDGELNENTWKQANPAKDFWQKYPQDKERAKRKTEIRASYDDKFLYFAATCYDTTYHIVQTLKRDSRYWEGDGIGFLIDAQNQRSNAFFFGVSPYNVQHDDLIVPFSDMSFSWDNKWYSATKIYPDRWTVEIAIPFKTLRYSADNKTWGINFIRTDAKNNQWHTWTHVPVQFNGIDLGYTGAMILDEAPKVQKGNISIIPYIKGGINTNQQEQTKAKGNFDAGLDAKVAVTSSLNLDLTVNPDFSQIEVDVQQTNLTRFSLFYPERRTFFLENDDIFSAYGAPPFRPFFSRTIGLDNNGQSVPILFGARLSGNVDKNWRIGVMNMQTGAKGERGTENYTPSKNFSALSLIRKVGERSAIKGYFLNRSGNMTDAEIKANPLQQFGRNAGTEFSYSDASGTWNAWGGYHFSMKPNITEKQAFGQIGGGYFGRSFSFFLDGSIVGKNYYADMGFLNRLVNYGKTGSSYDSPDLEARIGYSHLYNEIEYTYRPTKGKINQHRFGVENFFVWNEGGLFNEKFHRFRYFINFKNSSGFRFRIDPQMVNLLYYTPLPEKKPLAPGRYAFTQYNIQYGSDSRKKLAFTSSVRFGGFYNGTLQQYDIGATYRVQPWGNFSLGFQQNRLNFPDEYGSSTLFLINPRIEINFANNLFWTTFLQYNTQRNNFNINSRFQWRYKPMSDFYLVYTDNYFTDPLLKNKNRALVFKLNYWLTL